MALEKDVILAAGIIGLDEKGPNENSRQYCLMDRWRQGLSSCRLLCEGRQEYSLFHQPAEKALKRASFEGLTVDMCNLAFCSRVRYLSAAIFFPDETMSEDDSKATPKHLPLLKSYNACLISTIITIQAALSFAIPIYTSTSNLLSWTLASGVLVLHLLGTYSFHLSLVYLGVKRPRMIALYLIVPLGNIPCVIDLSKAVNAKMKEIGASRGMSLRSVRAIGADI